MPHALKTTVEDFVSGITALEQEPITSQATLRFMDAVRLSPDVLRPYSFFSDEFYTRNLLFRDHWFEVVALCWKPGQRTVIHTHNGQLGWMAMVQGEVAVHNYKYVRCDMPENQNVVGIDCLGGAHHIELDRIGSELCHEAGHISTVDKVQTIHQIECTDAAKAGVISLHVYSLPLDSCIAFDLEQQHCFRRTLHYHSRYGKVEIDAPVNQLGMVNIK